ncbi:MAG: hypothetical protein WD825_02950 [Gemmatimonadaceae bacterium]
MISPRFLLVALIAAAPSVAHAQGCISSASRLGKTSNQHISRNDDRNRVLTVRWQRGDCELRVDARGEFGVRADLTGFTTVESGGYVEIEERDGDRERKVRVTGGPAGLHYRWTIDGDSGFDVSRERWLSEILVAMERRTAMFAKARIPELLRRGGPNAVLEETDRMESDYARRVYFTTLLAAAPLDDAALERMLRQAGAMSSDYERSELLRAVASRGPMSERVTRAVIGVAHRMSSDYEKRRALSAGLESVTTVEARNALFLAASTMSSSYELAELLIAAQRRSLVDSISSVAYFRAVDKLTSDYEHRRTLSALLKQRPESPAVLSGVLRSSEKIGSDHELANLLTEFARVVPVRGELRELYLKAARAIESDYEYRRALQALLEQDRHT